MYRARDRSRWRPRFSLAERQRRRQGARRGFWSFSPWSPGRQMGYLGRDEVEEPSRLPKRVPVPIRQMGFLSRKGKPLRTLL